MAPSIRKAFVPILLHLLPFVLANEYNNLADVTCGQSETNQQQQRQARIVGGQDAVPREFPWLVSITRKGGHFCGGTIVSSKFVLTAAHCFCALRLQMSTKNAEKRFELGFHKKDRSYDLVVEAIKLHQKAFERDEMMSVAQLRVTLGEHDLRAPEQPGASSEIVRSMIVHPDFKCGKFGSDIALLELEAPVAWSESVRPACLPPEAGRSGYSVFSGKLAVTAGWGWLGEDKSLYSKSSVLQKVGVNVIEDEVCSEWYASQGKAFRVKYGQMCAGHENGGLDACAADSGGPLMFSGVNKKTMIIGIVSTGIGCARKRLPGIYTRVSEFVPWILKNTQK